MALWEDIMNSAEQQYNEAKNTASDLVDKSNQFVNNLTTPTTPDTEPQPEEKGFIERAKNDIVNKVSQYVEGAKQGFSEAQKENQKLSDISDIDQSGNVTPKIGVAQEDFEQQQALANKATSDFANETVLPTAGFIPGLTTPAVVTMLTSKAIDTYKNTEGTPLEKAGNALRSISYGPAQDIYNDPNLSQKFYQEPISTATNIGLAGIQAALPLYGAKRGMDIIKSDVNATLNKHLGIEPTEQPEPIAEPQIEPTTTPQTVEGTKQDIIDTVEQQIKPQDTRLSPDENSLMDTINTSGTNIDNVLNSTNTMYKNILDDHVNYLLKQSAQGAEKSVPIKDAEGYYTGDWQGGGTNNDAWYRDLLSQFPKNSLPSNWYNYLNGKQKTIPSAMKTVYEDIAKEQLRNGFTSEHFGEVEPHPDFSNLEDAINGLQGIKDKLSIPLPTEGITEAPTRDYESIQPQEKPSIEPIQKPIIQENIKQDLVDDVEQQINPPTKQPWEMTKDEFNDKAYYRGVWAGNPDTEPVSYWTDKPKAAQVYAQRTGPGGKIKISFADEYHPEVFNDEYGELTTWQDYKKNNTVLSSIKDYQAPTRAEIPPEYSDNAHKYLVEKAINEGKTVPSEVLADYPELQRIQSHEQPTTEPTQEPEQPINIPPINKSDYDFSNPYEVDRYSTDVYNREQTIKKTQGNIFPDQYTTEQQIKKPNIISNLYTSDIKPIGEDIANIGKNVADYLAPDLVNQHTEDVAGVMRDYNSKKNTEIMQAQQNLEDGSRYWRSLPKEQQVNDVINYQKGNTDALSPKAQEYFNTIKDMSDRSAQKLVDMGLLKPEQVHDFYMRQLWADTPENATILQKYASEQTQKSQEPTKNQIDYINGMMNKHGLDLKDEGIDPRKLSMYGAGQVIDWLANEGERPGSFHDNIVENNAGKGGVKTPNLFKTSSSILKNKLIPDYETGINELGLEPKLTNPAEISLEGQTAASKLTMSENIKKELTDSGELKRVTPIIGKDDAGNPQIIVPKPPEGMVRVGNPGDIQWDSTQGVYYAKPEVAKMIDNFNGKGFMDPNHPMNKAYARWMQTANLMNQSQLLGLYHMGKTSWEAMVSNATLTPHLAEDAISNISKGKFKDAASNIVDAVKNIPTIATPFTNLYKGKEFIDRLSDPKHANDSDIQAFHAGGGKLTLDSDFTTNYRKSMREAWANDNQLGAIPRAALAVPETLSGLTLEKWVPMQKAGTFKTLIDYELKRDPSLSLPENRAKLRNVSGLIWDSIDNRMGSINWDNLFLDPKFKQALFAAFRAPGFTGGTFKEVGGGLADIATANKRMAEGGRFMTPRIAYNIALPVTTIAANYAMQWMRTGEQPDLKDEAGSLLYKHKTGDKDEWGNDKYATVPSYSSQIASWFQKPIGETVVNKLHPLASTISQLNQNKDYFNRQIFNPKDEIPDQLKDKVKFIANQLSPFAIATAQNEAKDRGTTLTDTILNGTTKNIINSVLPQIGITPASKAMTMTEAQKIAQEIVKNNQKIGPITQEKAEITDLKTQLKKDVAGKTQVPDSITQALSDGKITKQEAKDIWVNRNKQPLEREVASPAFSLDNDMDIWVKATDAEKEQIRPTILKKINGIMKSSNALPADKQKALEYFHKYIKR